ncbi:MULTISPECIES: transglycosylase SLT domain-containing protein [unclassified Stenotrophomonas maltophilia group]|uniref:lytic transglycosylase domain-containing protein n=1 Tax=unclassified Stenotrophomonas maltophilia group TaxID=2961925 RepID=UPI003BF9227E
MALNYGGLLGRFIPQANGLSEEDRNAIGRQSLLSLGLGLLRPSGGSFGGALANGIQSGLLSANQGVQDAENARYKNEILGRTRQGMERNSAIEAAQQGALNPDGSINQEAWGKWAAIDPVGASTFRRENTPKAQNDWQLAQVGDGTQGGLLDVWVNKDTREIRNLQGEPISGGLLAPGAVSQSSVPPVGSDILPRLEQAVMQVESGGNPAAVSSKGAVGTMQTMPGTLRDPGYGVAPARDQSPAELERVGKDYLQAMLRQYADPRAALAAYNWGPGNVDNALRAAGGNVDAMLASAPAETRAYVPKVLAQVGIGHTSPSGGRIGWRPAKSQAPTETYRTLTAQEVADIGLPRGTVAQRGPNGSINVINKPTDGAGSTQPKTTEDQNKSAGYAIRMENALRDVAASVAKNKSADRPGVINTAIAAIPFTGEALSNYFNSPERQNVEAAQLDALDAALTLNTGAAYTKEQLKGLSKAYFPQIGDDDSTVQAKKVRLQSLIETARLRARSAYPDPGAGSGDPNIDSLVQKYIGGR